MAGMTNAERQAAYKARKAERDKRLTAALRSIAASRNKSVKMLKTIAAKALEVS